MPSKITQLQRYLSTEFIAKRRLNIPAVWLKPEGLTTSVEDAVADFVSTDLGAWDEQNLAVRLVDGHIEVRIESPDDVWVTSLFKAFRFLAVDARAAYGLHHVTSIIISVDDEPERWGQSLAKAAMSTTRGRKVRTEFRYSSGPTKTSKAIYRTSAAFARIHACRRDGFCWRPWGKPPADIIELGISRISSTARWPPHQHNGRKHLSRHRLRHPSVLD